MDIEKYNKFQVAESQLITAIDLFFTKRDPVSIHTLACASNEILDGLCSQKGLERSLIHRGVNQFVDNKKDKKEIINIINRPKNFFKHAFNEKEKFIEFNDRLSETIIWDSISMYKKITDNQITIEMLIFSAFFRTDNDHLWETDKESNEIKSIIELCKESINKETICCNYLSFKKSCSDIKSNSIITPGTFSLK